MHLGAALRLSIAQVKLLIGLEGFIAYQTQTNSEWCNIYSGVSRWVLRSSDERGTTQTIG
jgi:hypothetical protein